MKKILALENIWGKKGAILKKNSEGPCKIADTGELSITHKIPNSLIPELFFSKNYFHKKFDHRCLVQSNSY